MYYYNIKEVITVIKHMKKIFGFVFLALLLSGCDIDYSYDQDCHYHNDYHHCHEDPEVYYEYNQFNQYYPDYYGFEEYDAPCHYIPWEHNDRDLYCEEVYCYDFDWNEWQYYDTICF